MIVGWTSTKPLWSVEKNGPQGTGPFSPTLALVSIVAHGPLVYLMCWDSMNEFSVMFFITENHMYICDCFILVAKI